MFWPVSLSLSPVDLKPRECQNGSADELVSNQTLFTPRFLKMSAACAKSVRPSPILRFSGIM